jgi:hypothetical protein
VRVQGEISSTESVPY